MPRAKRTEIEYRNYELPPEFPIIVLTGDEWRISHVPSQRLHFHNCLEVGYCHSETGTLVFENTPLAFSAGDVTCVARNVPHTTFSATPNKSLWSYLFFIPDELLKSFLREQLPDNRVLQSMLHNSHMILSAGEYPQVGQLVLNIIDEMTKKKADYQLCVRALCMALLLNLLRAYDRESGRYAQDGGEYAIAIAPALDYVHLHYMEEFPQEKLAEECHLSPAHFRRLFLKMMGVNPLTFLHQTRILESCTLLRTTEAGIADIAGQVGYTTLSTFNRHFKEIIGITPFDWRRTVAPLAKPRILEYSGWTKAE